MKILCPICRDVFITESCTLAATCGHIFHEPCIYTWMKEKITCPQCRIKFKEPPSRVFLFSGADDIDSEDKLKELPEKIERLRRLNTKLKADINELNTWHHELRQKIIVTRSDNAAKHSEIQALKRRKSSLKSYKQLYLTKIEELKKNKEIIKKTYSHISILMKEAEAEDTDEFTPYTEHSSDQIGLYLEAMQSQAKKRKAKYTRMKLIKHEKMEQLKQMKADLDKANEKSVMLTATIEMFHADEDYRRLFEVISAKKNTKKKPMTQLTTKKQESHKNYFWNDLFKSTSKLHANAFTQKFSHENSFHLGQKRALMNDHLHPGSKRRKHW